MSEKCKCKTRVLLGVLNLYVREFTHIVRSRLHSCTNFLGLHAKKKSCERCINCKKIKNYTHGIQRRPGTIWNAAKKDI